MTTYHQLALTIAQGQPDTSSLNPVLPWIFLVLGLWLACVIWGIQLSSRIRQARKINAQLSAELRKEMDHQSSAFDSFAKGYGAEKRRWRLQVENRNKLLTDLNCRLARIDEEVKTDRETHETKVMEWQTLLQTKDRELETVRNETISERDKYKSRSEDLEYSLGEKEQQLDREKLLVIELENRINELEAESSEKDNRIEALETDLSDKQGARQLLDEVDGILDKQDHEVNRLRNEREQVREQLESRVTELEWYLGERDSEISQLKESAATHSTLAKQLQEREKQISDLESALGEKDLKLESRNSRQFNLENRINELELENAEQAQTIQVLKEELSDPPGPDNAIGEIEKRDEELNKLREERETIRKNLKNRVSSLESEVVTSRTNLEQEKKTTSELYKSLREMEVMVQDRDTTIARLEKDLQENEGARRSLAKLKKEHGQFDEILQLREIQPARTNGNGTSAIVNFAAASEIKDLEKLLSERTEELNGLRYEKEGLAFELEQKEKEITALRSGESDSDKHPRISELETVLHDLEGELVNVRREKDELQNRLNEGGGKPRIEELEWLLGERDGQLEELRNALWAREHQKGERIAELEWLLGERDGELGHLRHENEQKQKSLESLRHGEHSAMVARIEELNWLLGERDAELNRLRDESGGKSNDLDNLHNQNGEKQNRIDELEWLLGERDTRIEQLEWLLGERDGELNHLREEKNAELDQYSQKCRQLEADLQEYSRESDTVIQEPTADANVITAETAFTDEPVKMDRLVGPVYSSRPDEVDDLSKLNGMTDRYVELLHNFGVYRYKQIALWNTRYLKQFTLLLNINGTGRIDLNHWIKEATELHREKYGETIQLSPATVNPATGS